MDFPRFLMCPPLYFAVNWKINEWMEPNNWQEDGWHTAQIQWRGLVNTMQDLGAKIELITPQPGMHDMCFVANAGYVADWDKRVIQLGKFLNKEREQEEYFLDQYFTQRGYHMHYSPVVLEGAGEVLWDHFRGKFWLGYGFRNQDHACHHDKITLKLVNPLFYHLDTCLAILPDGEVVYYPGAFDEASVRMIEMYVKPKHRVVLDQADAERFAANLIHINDNLILSDCSMELENQFGSLGYKVHKTPTHVFQKAGGSVACLTLRLP